MAGIRSGIHFYSKKALVKTFSVSGIEMQMPSIPSPKICLRGTQKCGYFRSISLTPLETFKGELHRANVFLCFLYSNVHLYSNVLSKGGCEGQKVIWSLKLGKK